MFKDKQDYEKYIEKQKVTNADLREENYFEHNDNGEIILKKQDYNTSALDVEKYTNCVNWVLLKDQKTMALLKRPFGDIYRELTKEQYYVSLYNNILLPQIAKQFQNKSAQYYIVAGNKFNRNMKQILTVDFKKKNEELVHGEEILEESDGNINELNIQSIMKHINKYLNEKGFKSQDTDTIKKEFIKQSLFDRFVKQTDENNHNWGILLNEKEKRARITPIYDLDCCCESGTLRKKVRTTSDGSKYDFGAFFRDFGDKKWFNKYVEEVIEDFDINKAIQNAKTETGIEIPTEIKEHYKNFFGERFYEFKGAYQKFLTEEIDKEKQNEVR